MLIADILNSKGREIHSISPDETVFEAISLMADKNIGALLVLNKEGKLIGIITERDYRNKVILKGRASKTTKVKEIMTTRVNYTTPTETVFECLALMTERKFRHLPVMNGQMLEGIVSIGDLVKAVIQEQQIEIDGLRDYISGNYPG